MAIPVCPRRKTLWEKKADLDWWSVWEVRGLVEMLFLIFAVVSLACIMGRYWYIMGEGVPTVARVVGYRERGDSDGTDYFPVLEYWVDGVAYHGKHNVGLHQVEKCPIGEVKHIRYLAHNPRQFVDEDQDTGHLMLLPVCLFLCLLLVFQIAYW